MYLNLISKVSYYYAFKPLEKDVIYRSNILEKKMKKIQFEKIISRSKNVELRVYFLKKFQNPQVR